VCPLIQSCCKARQATPDRGSSVARLHEGLLDAMTSSAAGGAAGVRVRLRPSGGDEQQALPIVRSAGMRPRRRPTTHDSKRPRN